MDSVLKQIEDIHATIDELVSKFDKGDNKKAAENEITREFKKVRQLIGSINQKDPNLQKYKRMTIEKEEMSKYLLELKKGVNKPDSRALYIEKLKKTIKEIVDRIQGLQKKNKQVDKRKRGANEKSVYEKNVDFLKLQQTRLEKLKDLLESGCVFSIENMQKLYSNYLDDLFTTMGDSVFQQQTEQLYSNMFVLASLKQPPPEVIKPVKQNKDKEEAINRRDFRQMMALSYENLPKWNEYRPSNQIKQKLEEKVLLPAYRMIDLSTISKMNNETLFFIFYYQKGAIEQYFAAKQLKNRNWRYHLKHFTWFRRYDMPTQETPDFQKGSYMYFDYEKSWQIRRKTEFVMKLHSLEDSI